VKTEFAHHSALSTSQYSPQNLTDSPANASLLKAFANILYSELNECSLLIVFNIANIRISPSFRLLGKGKGWWMLDLGSGEKQS
jgi:hypothetical protein